MTGTAAGGGRSYHHGNVPDAVMRAALDEIPRVGAAALSLRSLAARIGVSHGAVAHHFGDKTGLLTALAAEGFSRLADVLFDAWSTTGDFGAVGVAYVQFATENPAHFELMFRPELCRGDHDGLIAARMRAAEVLYGSAEQVADAAGGDVAKAGVAAWAYVHGVAMLWKDGNLPPPFAHDPVALAEEITPYLFQASTAGSSRRRR